MGAQEFVRTLGASASATNAYPFRTTRQRYQHCYSSTELNLAGGGGMREVWVRLGNRSQTPATWNTFRGADRCACADFGFGAAWGDYRRYRQPLGRADWCPCLFDRAG